MKGMIVSLLFIIFLIGLLVFLLSFLIHQRKILKVLIFFDGNQPDALSCRDYHLSTHKFIIKGAQMNTNDFDFDLPEELIAQTPLENEMPLNS